MKKLFLSLLILLFTFTSNFSWGDDNFFISYWRITEDDGHISTYKFKSDGFCSYYQEKSPSGNEGLMQDNCKWEKNNNVLMFNNNRFYVTRIAIIEGDTLTGFYASNWQNSLGTFTGKKLN